MRIYPAIDLQHGRCVRLLQGRKEDETVYADRPEEMAAKWIDQGAEILHVVDLDGAFGDGALNEVAIQRICSLAKSRGIPIQLGGGIRSMTDLEKRLKWGVDRAIIGTAALENPIFVREAAHKYPGRIIAGIDARAGIALTRGWEVNSDILATDLGKRMAGYGILQCVYTDTNRDGMMRGPNIPETLRMQGETGLQIIASGGVSTLEDISALTNAGLFGAIVGKALYEGVFSLEQAINEARGKE